MKVGLIVLLVFVGLFGHLVVPVSAQSDEAAVLAGGNSPVIVVDCDQGGRVAQALQRASHRTGPVEILIQGMCEESVIIDRPQLTLRGRDPATDGIRGDGRLPNTVMLDTVWKVQIENLSILGLDPSTRTALGIGESFSIGIVHCRLEGTVFGAIGARSNFGFEDTTLIGGLTALQVSAGSGARCTRCTLDDGGAGGRALRVENATFTLEDSSLEARVAVRVGTGGAVTIRRSSLRARPDAAGRVRAISLTHASRLSLQGSTVEGTLFASEKSIILFDDVAQSFDPPSPESHTLALDSVLRTSGTTTLGGDLLLSSLAEAILEDGTVLGGALVCDPTSQAWCFGTVSVGGSNCAECPGP